MNEDEKRGYLKALRDLWMRLDQAKVDPSKYHWAEKVEHQLIQLADSEGLDLNNPEEG